MITVILALAVPIIEDSGLRNNKDRFTASGNRRKFKQLHDIVTLENIVKAMYKDNDSKGIGNFGKNIYGSAAQEYKNIGAVKADSERLQTLNKPVYNQIREELGERFRDLARHFAIRDSGYSDASDLLCEAVAKNKTKASIANYIKREGEGWTNYSDYVVDELMDIVDELRSMPQDYFEAKPERVVYNNEIKGAVIPADTSTEIKGALRKNSIDYVEYEKGDTDDRISKVNELADSLDIKFSRRIEKNNLADYNISNDTERNYDNGYRVDRRNDSRITEKISNSGRDRYLADKKHSRTQRAEIRGTGAESGKRQTEKNGINFTYSVPSKNETTPQAEKTKEFLTKFGLESEVFTGKLQAKKGNEIDYLDDTECASAGVGIIFVGNNADGTAEENAGHEAFHEYFNSKEQTSRTYSETVISNLLNNKYSQKFIETLIDLGYTKSDFVDEISAYMSGWLFSTEYGNVNDQNSKLLKYFSKGFNNFEDIKVAHLNFINAVYKGDTKASLKTRKDAIPEEYQGMTTDQITEALVKKHSAIKKGENPVRNVDVPKKDMFGKNVSQGSRTIMEAEATSEEMVEHLQEAVGQGDFSYNVIKDKDAVGKATDYIEKYGFKKTYESWRNKVDNNLTITKDDMTMAQIMYASAVAVDDFDTALKLATDIAIQATKAGQVVQSMRILKKTTPEGRLYYMQKSVDAIQEDIKDRYGDKAPTIKVDDQLIENLKDARTQEEIDEATMAINLRVAKQLPFSFNNFINSWRYLSMLGNTRTQMRNVASNVIGALAQEYTNFVQVGLEKGFKTKEKTSAIKTTQWQKEMAEADYKLVEKELSGQNKYRNDSLTAIQKLQNPFDFKGKGGAVGDAVGKVLTKWNETTNWAMDAGDKLFSAPAYKRYYARYLAANKITSEDQLTDKMKMAARAWAKKQAEEVVYRENNALAKAISKFETDLAKSNSPAVRTGAKVVGGLMPFRGTPLNITKRAFEYTPVGIAYELVNQKANKIKDPVALVNKAAKSLSGTSLMLLGYALANSGMLTGGLDDDKEDKLKKQMGEQAYSINVGNVSYTLDWAGAAVMPLFVGAQMYQQTQEDSDNFFEAMLDTFANASAPIMETSMMTGMMDALQTASYEDNAFGKLTSVLASGFSSYLSQMVPTLLGQLARSVDDTSRSSYTDSTGIVKIFDKSLQKVQNKIPIASMSNVPYMDVWGNDVKNVGGNPIGRLLYNTLSPGYAEKKSTDKVEKMLQDVYDKTGETSVLPSNYTTYKKVGGETIRFDDKQYETYTKTYGQTAYDLLEELTADSKFKSLEDMYKAEVIGDIYRYSTAVASNKVVDKELTTRQVNQQKAMDTGIDAYHIFMGGVMADEAGNGNGYLSKDEAIAYIEKQNLSKLEKAYLFSALGNSNWKNPYA